jgi:hypothetical protein
MFHRCRWYPPRLTLFVVEISISTALKSAFRPSEYDLISPYNVLLLVPFTSQPYFPDTTVLQLFSTRALSFLIFS